jgi:ribosomal protein L37AE/L43A
MSKIDIRNYLNVHQNNKIPKNQCPSCNKKWKDYEMKWDIIENTNTRSPACPNCKVPLVGVRYIV